MKKLIVLLILLSVPLSANAAKLSEVRTNVTTKFPNDIVKQIDYDVRTDSNPVYVGYALRGTATSADAWTIQYLTYDGSDRVTSIETAYGSWDNRASLTYE